MFRLTCVIGLCLLAISGACVNQDKSVSTFGTSKSAIKVTPEIISDRATIKKVLVREVWWDLHGRTNKETELDAKHPNLTGVILPVAWSEVQPTESQFNWTALDARIQWWSDRGKRVILRPAVLGTASTGNIAPAWLEQENVPFIEFQAKPRDTQKVRIPVVWNPQNNFMACYSTFVSALGMRYNGKVAGVWIATGHLGLTTADATAGGAIALPQAGWTIPAWTAYIKSVVELYDRHFSTTQIILPCGALWTRNATATVIVPSMQELSIYASTHTASLMLKGVDPDSVTYYKSTPFAQMLDTLSARSLPLGFTLYMGNDWPLWVEPAQRQGPTANRDDAGFQSALGLMKVEWNRIQNRGKFGLVLLDDEIRATNPLMGSAYHPEVRNILLNFLVGR